jgi:hypothetical protein
MAALVEDTLKTVSLVSGQSPDIMTDQYRLSKLFGTSESVLHVILQHWSRFFN